MLLAKAFDFNNKTDISIQPSEIFDQIDKGNYCWITAEPSDLDQIKTILERENVSKKAFDDFINFNKIEGRYEVYPKCLQFTVTEARISETRIVTSQVDVALTSHCMIMVFHDPADFLYKMRSANQEDFIKFSKSPSFLLYEIGDFILDIYRETLRVISADVEDVQLSLFGQVDDEIFKHVSDLTTDLLHFRRVVLAARDVMHELGTRRSPYVSESTQPFLDRMAERLERLCEDITAEREALNEMLHLYMGMVSHRTNKIINRLTVLNTIFLPLAFLCGVFGMNFVHMPELEWKYSYLGFWIVAASISTALVFLMKRKKWL